MCVARAFDIICRPYRNAGWCDSRRLCIFGFVREIVLHFAPLIWASSLKLYPDSGRCRNIDLIVIFEKKGSQ
jgi:hypothetical protein